MRIQLKLRRWCDENSLEWLAFKAEVSAGYVHKIIRGERVPSLKLAKRFQRITQGAIKVKDWERARKELEQRRG